MIEYREISKEEIPRVAELYINLIISIKQETKDPYFEINNFSKELLINNLEKYIQNETQKIFVAIENNSIVGFIAGEIIDCFLPFSKVTRIGYISAAYVSVENRNNGIMKKLEKIMADFFKKYKLEYAELNVLSNNFIGKKVWNKLGYNTFREQMRKKI